MDEAIVWFGTAIGGLFLITVIFEFVRYWERDATDKRRLRYQHEEHSTLDCGCALHYRHDREKGWQVSIFEEQR